MSSPAPASTASDAPVAPRAGRRTRRGPSKQARYPGIDTVIHGNGAVAHVMGHVCGGVIGYPITPSTEISELFEAFRAQGGCNVWGRHPFFFEPEGEHSAQSGALGAALTGGKYVSNASSSQGILYGLESHYVTVGKKIGGFVLQVAARVVSRHSLNVMAGHDDVYALLPAGYTILFGSNPQEAADLAAIAYKVSALSLVPVANAMDGFATSHMHSRWEHQLPEPELLREFLEAIEVRAIPLPHRRAGNALWRQGRVFQLRAWIDADTSRTACRPRARRCSHTSPPTPRPSSTIMRPRCCRRRCSGCRRTACPWKRQWTHAAEKGTRQRVRAGRRRQPRPLAVQNQPDFQAGVVDHQTHFVSAVPKFVREAMREYSALTGRSYAPIKCHRCDDADYVIVGLGSVTDDAEAVADYLRRRGLKAGVISVKLLQPFPEAELVAALAGKKAVTVLERCEITSLTSLVTHALFKAAENHGHPRHAGIPALERVPQLSTGIFGLGAHDLQPRHLVAVYENMSGERNVPFFYLGSQFFAKNPGPRVAELQARLRAAYPETELMALETGPNPNLLPNGGFRVRFHSVGGYGTIATGKLLTDILAGVLGLHSKSAPKYGSEKSGAPTSFYLTLSPEPIKLTNAELEDVEVVVSPDHKAFSHSNPLRGLAKGGTLVLQSHHTPLEVWKELPAKARLTIRERRIHLFVVDAFAVARKHAPSPDLEIRMMGIAFIGAVCGHVERVTAGTTEEEVLARVREQIQKKFGSKGAKVVESNMAVIREGLEATRAVDYEGAEFRDADRHQLALSRIGVEVSASMTRTGVSAATAGFFDREYFREVVTDRHKDGTIAEAPVLPGAGLFMPVASAAWKDKGLFRLQVPKFMAHLCTGCMECAMACPDGAIPNSVHEIHDLLLGAIRGIEATEQQKQLMAAEVFPLTKEIRDAYRRLPAKDPKPFHEIAAAAVARAIDTDSAPLRHCYDRMIEVLRRYPVVKTRPYFDAMEKAMPATGGLYSVNVDPWKCSGCLECVDVCGPGALVAQAESQEVDDELGNALEFLSRLPNTAARFHAGATQPGGEPKRLLLDRHNYYAMSGGHGACRGCGETTAIRLLTATNRAIHQDRRRRHARELEQLLPRLEEKIARTHPDPHDPQRVERMRETARILERRLYRFESGPTGEGPASALLANATGCSSVYASTFPFNPYTDPWVNSLFQDTAPLAKGMFEGLCADAADDFRALRTAKLDLEDHYDPATHDFFFRYFHWSQFSDEEMALLPAVIGLGGDGATYDIGFGALSRLLSTDTPIKMVVLNTGCYSNTGGQASTSSYTAQDSDLSRFGQAHIGKQEARKEMGLIAAFHPKVLVVQTTAALQAHFMRNLMEFLTYHRSPALFDVYTPCMSEHGIADDASNRHARLAVESRMSPVFVHDPRRGETLAERFSLEGNPDIGKDWTTTTLQHVDEQGQTQLKEIPLTPADFALREGRFKKHFHRLGEEIGPVPVHEYVELGEEERYGRTPFVWSTDENRRLIRMSVSPAIVLLVEERRRNWRMLEYLAGLHVERLSAAHRTELEELQQRYEQATADHEASLDAIARGMAELASGSSAPAGGPLEITIPLTSIGRAGQRAGAAAASDAAASEVASQAVSGTEGAARGASVGAGTAVASASPLVEIRDPETCTNCKTCYQNVSEVFEKTVMVVNGEAREVSRVIAGALDRLKMTPELVRRLERAADDCDALIIQVQRPN
ncbi:MAG: 2-oxoacid:acceptor oxidoreductase family protein [Steroidobacteraceae bacterium]